MTPKIPIRNEPIKSPEIAIRTQEYIRITANMPNAIPKISLSSIAGNTIKTPTNLYLKNYPFCEQKKN
jgi:hypothetical protein